MKFLNNFSVSKWELLKMSRQHKVFSERSIMKSGLPPVQSDALYLPWSLKYVTHLGHQPFEARGWYPVGFSIEEYKTVMVSLRLLKEILNVNPGILAGMWRKILSFTKVARFWMVQHPCSFCSYFYETLQRKTAFEERYCIDSVLGKTSWAPTQKLTDFHSTESTYNQEVNIKRT